MALDAGWYLPDQGLQLVDDAPIYDWLFSANRGGYEEKATNSVQGILYEQAVKLVLPKDNPDVRLALERMAGRKWLLIYTDANGLTRLVGTKRQPLRLQQQFSNGRNEHVLTWTGNTRLPALYLTDADALSLGALIAYQFDFSRL
jgi:hypothetical protein